MDFTRSIKTEYGGIEYKSRLEADIAWIIKRMKYEFEYEPINFLLPSGIHYWPDFYIPDIHLWIEGRGYQTDKGQKQIEEFSGLIKNGFIMPDKTLSTEPDFGMDLLPFEELNKKDAPDYLVIGYESVRLFEYVNRFGCGETQDTAIVRCTNCKHWYFIGQGSFQCRKCGAWDGNGHIDRMEYFEDIGSLKEIFLGVSD